MTAANAALKSQISTVFGQTLEVATLALVPFQLVAALWVGGRNLLAYYAYKARVEAGREAAEAKRRAKAARRFGR